MTNPIEITSFMVNTYFGHVNGEEFSVEIPRDGKGNRQYELAKSTVALDPVQLQEAVEFATLVEVSSVRHGPDENGASFTETIYKRRGKLYGVRHFAPVTGNQVTAEHASLDANGEVIWSVRPQGAVWEAIGEAA